MIKFIKTYYCTILIGLAVLILSTINTGSLSLKIKPISNGDKVVHMLFYMAITLSLLFDHSRRMQLDTKRLTYIIAASISIFMGGAIELIQHFLPYRSASPADMIANIIGTAIGIIIYYIANKIYTTRCKRDSSIK